MIESQPDTFNYNTTYEYGSGQGLIVDLLIPFVFWSLLQCVFYSWPNLEVYKIAPKTELDLRNRMVSFFHGATALGLSAYQVFCVPYGCGDATSQMHYLILANSGGYFLYDVACMAKFGLLELDMALHHGLCIVGIIVVLLDGHDTCHVVAGLFVAEVSNPAMHMRVMLRNIGKRYTLCYEVAEYAYFVMFFFGRVIMGHPVVYDTVTCESMNLMAKIVSLGVLA